MADDLDIIPSIVVSVFKQGDGIDAFFARVEPRAEAVAAPLRRSEDGTGTCR